MDDWTVLVKNAIAILVILTAIALIVFLAFLGLNSANRGGEKLSESVGALDARSMETYDQKTISGTTVLAAVKNYKNTSAAIIVVTNSTIRNYNAQIVAVATPTTRAFTNTATPGGNTTQVFVLPGSTGAIAHGIRLLSTFMVAPELQNVDMRNVTDSGRADYINPSAKFRSCLIYNSNDEVSGIYMKQTTAPTTGTGAVANHLFTVP